MLEMKGNCESCDKSLPPGSTKARICSLEHTYCSTCSEKELGGKCSGCKGELMQRPRRAAKYLAEYPPSTKPTHKTVKVKKTVAKRVL